MNLIYQFHPQYIEFLTSNQIFFADNSTHSPLLKPYPSWEAHNLDSQSPELVSPYRIRADRCGRLWVLDTRRMSPGDNNQKSFGATQLLVYDLHNDNLLRRYVFPMEQIKQDSLFINLAVEDGDCQNTFAYAADSGSPGLVVYSWSADDSWRVMHHFFYPDPTSGNYTIANVEFQSDYGLYGMALSKNLSDGYATLYFHPFSSTMEFSVSTEVLRNRTLATSDRIYELFKILGTRGPNAQAGASFLDTLTGVLFYALPNLNAIACWKTSNRAYTIKSQGRVYMNPVEMVFPSDIKIDDQDRLWVLSNRLQDYLYGELSNSSTNFRILTAHVNDAIENTACDIKSKPLPEIINKLGNILNTTINKDAEKTRTKSINSSAGSLQLNSFAVIMLGLGLSILSYIRIDRIR